MIVNENNGFALKPDMYSQNEWYQMYLSMLKEYKKLQQELEKLKKPINYYQYASKNLKDKNEQLKQENARLKDKLKNIENILVSNHDVEHIYCALSQYLNIYDY